MSQQYTLEYASVEATIPRLMMEITTGYGCSVSCKFCPQKTFLLAYKSNIRKLSLKNFQRALANMPKDIGIIFSGFAEPFLNAECSKMILHAHETGHPVSLFTTGTGMTAEDLSAIQNIPFSELPHGGFVLHLADNERYAKINVNDDYIRLLEMIKESNIHNLLLRTMGSVHQAIRHIFPQDAVTKQTMNTRAGYLSKEGIQAEHSPISHKGQVICGRDEHVYNNVLLPNGDVVLCCQDFGLKHILGNIFKDPYEEIVPNPLAPYELCKTCHNAIALPQNFPSLQISKPRNLNDLIDISQIQ